MNKYKYVQQIDTFYVIVDWEISNYRDNYECKAIRNKGRQIYRHINIQIDGQIDRYIDLQIYRYIDIQINRQIYKYN